MKYQRSRSTLFLMELIIAICFFAITSAVCAQVFAKAHLVSQKTTDLNHAIAQAQSMAEAFRACDGDITETASLFPGGLLEENRQLTIYYDENWQQCSAPDTYKLTLTPGPAKAGDAMNADSGEPDAAASTTDAADENTLPAALDTPQTDRTAALVSAEIIIEKASDGSEIYRLNVQKFVKGT